MADNTGRYITYAELLAELAAASSPKVTKSGLTLSSKTVDPGGDIYNFVATGGGPAPLIGDVVEQAGFADVIIAILTTPDRLQIFKTGAENVIANGPANLLHSDEIPLARGNSIIDQKMEFIDQWTGQFFNKRTGVFEMQGSNAHMMHFNVPIIEITKLLINDTDIELFEGDDKDFEAFKGRTQPQDDRRNPKIRLNLNNDSIFSGVFTNRVFLKNTRSTIEGSFGFLEPDGNTPSLIKRATALLVFESINQPSATVGLTPSVGTLRRVKVDLHEKEFFEDRGINRGFQATDNKEVNNILAMYKRPILVATTFKTLRNINSE